MGVSLAHPPHPKTRFQSSPLRYASEIITQYQTTVKLPGSFRLAAGKQHLHCYCIFTGRLVETVFNSLGHSCGPELTRQGITLPLDDSSFYYSHFSESLYVAIEIGLYLHFLSVWRIVSEDSFDKLKVFFYLNTSFFCQQLFYFSIPEFSPFQIL